MIRAERHAGRSAAGERYFSTWAEIYPPSSVAERDSFPPRGSLRENPFTLHNRVKKWQIKPLFSAKSCICVVFAMLALPQIRLPLGGEENCKQFVAISD